MNDFNISIGILSYKRTDLLIETIRCIANTNYTVELVILNNNIHCIMDEIQLELKSVNNITINYLHFEKNLGVSSGRREIITACSSEHLILLDDDVHIDNIDLIITSVLDEFNADDKLGAIAFNIKEFNSGKNNRYEIPHKNKKINMSADFLTYLIIGAGNALKVPAVIDCGNFANDFGLYGFEEIDVAFRLISIGYKIKYKSNCVIKHKKSPDGRFNGVIVNQLYFENRTRMAKRYLNNYYYISCLLVRGGMLLLKTKSLKVTISSFKKVMNDKVNRKFNSKFYLYIKNVNGFLWY